MKKKKYILLAMMAALFLMSCGGGDGDEPSPTPTPPKKGQMYFLTCDMPAEASEKTVALKGLTSAITKKVQAVATDWLTVSKVPYTTCTPEVTVACTQNQQTTKRVMDVVFIAANDTLMLTVSQAAYSITEETNTENPYDTPTDQPAYSR